MNFENEKVICETCQKNWTKVIDIHVEPTSEFSCHRNIKQVIDTHRLSAAHIKCCEAKLNNTKEEQRLRKLLANSQRKVMQMISMLPN